MVKIVSYSEITLPFVVGICNKKYWQACLLVQMNLVVVVGYDNKCNSGGFSLMQ